MKSDVLPLRWPYQGSCTLSRFGTTIAITPKGQPNFLEEANPNVITSDSQKTLVLVCIDFLQVEHIVVWLVN